MLKFLIEKEFKQIYRNSILPKIIIIMPLVIILIMPWAASQEVKDIKLSLVDNDKSVLSERMLQKIIASNYFILTDISPTSNQAMQQIDAGEADIILEIQQAFENDLINHGNTEVMLSVNSINGTKSTLATTYLTSILTDYATELREEYAGTTFSTTAQIPKFDILTQYKFNAQLDYKIFMVPALMVMLLTIICGFLPALNIVREKETGTIEQINVSPVKKIQFVLAKLIPYWIIGYIILSICLVLSALVYNLIPAGSILTIYFFTSIYILTVSGMGLVISNYSDTVQQAMFVMYFFIIILLLISGLFTPIASMPEWARAITTLNPLKYFIQVMRMVFLKDSGFKEMLPQLLSLVSFALVLNIWAVLSYKKSN